MEPKTQVEIQLGHMCNNRCVFCVSGQQTALGRAGPMAVDPILHRLTEAFTAGHRKVTLLGGEPTLQPGFLAVVEHAVALGFEEVVVFTNGVKTAREGFIEEVIATGANLTWRISIQGATEESHDRTTRRPGSFARILRSMAHLKRLGQRLTVNMCVVGSNYESVVHFPALIREFGIQQLHLDMVRPSDAGERTEAELEAMMVPYSSLVPALTRLVETVPVGFDLNIGNLPYCVAPALALSIHHDGETTYTVAVDGENRLSRPWDKYFVKRKDKHKPQSCSTCVFDPRCNGVFDRYRDLHGHDELAPVTRQRLAELDPSRALLALHLHAEVLPLTKAPPPPPFRAVSVSIHGDREVHATLLGDDPLTIALRDPGPLAASFDAFGIALLRIPESRAAAKVGLDWLWERLSLLGHRAWHPLAHDALSGEVSPVVATRLGRLRRTAPHGPLVWTSVSIRQDGRFAELRLSAPDGERATFWLEDRGGSGRAGYSVSADPPGKDVVDGLRAMMSALSP